MMIKKIDILRAHMRAGQWENAIKLAAKFPRLGAAKADITRARDALLRPAFYRQIGKEPSALFDQGKAALISRYEK